MDDEPDFGPDVDEHPELRNYVPIEGMPHRRHRLRVMRVVVVVGVACLVLPTVLGTWQVARDSAARTCRALVARDDTAAFGSTIRFEPLGDGGPGWYCYSVDFGDRELQLANLGLIPAGGGVRG